MHSITTRFRASLCLRVFALCAAVLITSQSAMAQTAATGAIRGAVSNQSTSRNLEGVTVLVRETGRQVLTEAGGRYEITGLPPGTYTLVFEYPGLDRAEAKVVVGDGAPVQQDMALGSEIYQLATFVVTGEREGNAAAIAAQRNATNIQNVITSDAFGNIAKGNIGNFLKRLPGLAGTTDEVETGNIVLRGMGAEFTRIDLDGGTITSGGSGRGQNAAAIPADLIERVEVVKALTPDMDPDSLGGRINLITKSAYDRKDRAIMLRAAGSYSFTYGDDVGKKSSSAQAPSLAASYSDVFSLRGGKNNLGIYASANWERIQDVRGTTSWGDNYTTVSGVEYPRFNNASTALHGLERSGAALKADYKVSDDLIVGVSANVSEYIDNMYRVRSRLRNGTVRAPLSGDPYFIVVDGANYGTEGSRRHQIDDTTAGRAYFKYANAGGWRLNGEVSYSRTKRDSTNDSHTFVSNKKLDYVLDRRESVGDPRWPTIGVTRDFYTGTTSTTTVAPTSYLAVNPFSDNFSDARPDGDSQWQKLYADNQRQSAKLDLIKRFSGRWPIELKSGLKYETKETSSWREDLRGRINVTTAGFGPNLSYLTDPDWDLRGGLGHYPLGIVLDPERITQAMGVSFKGTNADPALRWNYDPTKFTINTSGTREQSLRNTRTVWEDVYGAYGMGQVEMGKLTIMGGVRYEETRNERDQAFRRRALAGTVDEWTARQRDSTSYDKLFPSLHTSYSFNRYFKLKAAYSTASGRPDWGSILGVTDINPVERSIDVPNIDLRPRYTKNIDVSLEYYFEPVGVISVGVFQKKITDFDADTTEMITPEQAADYGAVITPGDTTLWELNTKKNVGIGKVRGIELNYSQQLSNILPGALRGFGVFGNYTYLSTKGTFDNDASSGTQLERDRLEKFIPRTANAGVSYVYNRFDLRLSWNYTGAWDENTQLSNVATTKVRGARWQLDFSGKYQLTQKITLFLDLVNLTENHGLKYRGFVDPARRNETNALGFLGTGGILVAF
jgi:iron complex outermembrane receptor protein